MTTPHTRRREWLAPTALIMLVFIPVAAGASRIAQLAAGAAITPANARFFASPAPVVVHIVGASAYCLLGAFQFVPGIRRKRPGLHRAAGWLLIPCGLAAAVSGLWMTLFYPRPPDVGNLLTGFRLVFGSAMAVSVVLGLLAIRRRDVARHRAWMSRAYAIGVGAGTQAVTQLPWILAFGTLDKLSKALLMLAAWVINLTVAEWLLRRSPSRRARRGRRPDLPDLPVAVLTTRAGPTPDSGGSRGTTRRGPARIPRLSKR
jgi:uncharacterized membrane protein